MIRSLATLMVSGALLAGAPVSAVTISSGFDTFVREAAPNTSYGGGARVEWDGADGGGQNHALLRFNIFQSEGGPVNPTALGSIANLRARLQLQVVNPGDGGSLYRLTTPFVENTSWNALGGSGVVPGVNALGSADATAPAMGIGTYSIDVTSSLQAWAATPATNLGWGILPAGNNGLEFASFESGNGPQLILETATDYVTRGVAGSVWSYYDAIQPPPAAGSGSYPTDALGQDWRDLTFDDSSWASGPGQLGYGDGDETTTVAPGNITYLFRTTFLAGDTPDELWLELLRDDSAVVYLNGIEVLRDNLPAGIIDPTTTASGTGPENNLGTFGINTAALLPNQLNVLAVEIHNASRWSSDISFDLGLSGSSPLALAAVPEPGTGALLGLGLLLLALRPGSPTR